MSRDFIISVLTATEMLSTKALWLLTGSASAAYQASALHRNAWVPSDFFQLCLVAWPTSNTGAGTGLRLSAALSTQWSLCSLVGRGGWYDKPERLFSETVFSLALISDQYHFHGIFHLHSEALFCNFLKTVMLIYYRKENLRKLWLLEDSCYFFLPLPGVAASSFWGDEWKKSGSCSVMSDFQVDSLLAEPQGKPKNTGVGTFSSRSSLPRNWTGVFSIAGGFFTSWAIREAQKSFSFQNRSLKQKLFSWLQFSALRQENNNNNNNNNKSASFFFFVEWRGNIQCKQAIDSSIIFQHILLLSILNWTLYIPPKV